MSSDIATTNNQLTTPASNQVSLLEMRMDAKRFPRVGTFSREDAILEMSKIVSQAFLYKGQAADPTNIQFISCSLVDELQSDLDRIGTRNVSFAEISRVVKRAVLQDEMYGISVASLYRIIVGYIKGEGHRLHEQVMEMKRKKDRESMRNSIIAPMVQAYAGQLAKNTKV